MWQTALEPLFPQLEEHFAQPVAPGHRRAQWLVWYALFHDVGKPDTQTVEQTDGATRIRFLHHEQVGAEYIGARLAALRFSRDEISLAAKVVREHMRPHLLHSSFPDDPISRRARYRFFRDTGGQQYDRPPGVDVTLLALADYQATYGGVDRPDADPGALADWNTYLAHALQLLHFAFDADGLSALQQRPLVNGHVLMEHLNLKPGPHLGQLLDHLSEAQVAGDVHTAEEALEFADAWLRANTEGRA
jgi:poly(A) polymerase/tRNA nucleotidyltransferase (CCA-adding enzyme)